MKSFWEGRSCLVTGADGFVGAHLIKELAQNNSVVTGLVRSRKAVSTLDLLDVSKNMNLEYGDLTSFRTMRRLIDFYQVDTCFHLAATTIVSAASKSPQTTLENNIMGTWNLLEAARVSTTVNRIVVASSDKAYGDHKKDLPYVENRSALRGLGAYECSKASADLISQMYFFQYRQPVRITRCSNIYGPGDLNFTRLVPGTIMRILLGDKPIVHAGREETYREYLYVEDAVKAYLRLAETIRPFQELEIPKNPDEAFSYCAYNVGGGNKNVQSVGVVIQSIMDQISSTGSLETVPKPREEAQDYIEIRDQFLNSEKISRLGWGSSVALIPEGLERTINWYQEHLEEVRNLAISRLKLCSG